MAVYNAYCNQNLLLCSEAVIQMADHERVNWSNSHHVLYVEAKLLQACEMEVYFAV